MDAKKRNVSVRMSSNDLRRIRELARRMQVRESDVFRFAVKTLLAKLTPLNDTRVKGKDLLPVFVDCYADLTRYFEFDTARLERIINAGVEEPDQRVDRDDIELLVMAGIQEGYVHMKLKYILGRSPEQPDLAGALKEYLLEKYIGSMDVSELEPALENA